MHSRDIMPAYLPTDKQVIENPDVIYTEALLFFFSFFLLMFSLKYICRLSPDSSVEGLKNRMACISDHTGESLDSYPSSPRVKLAPLSHFLDMEGKKTLGKETHLLKCLNRRAQIFP